MKSRSATRVLLPTLLEVRCADSGQTIGHVVDLSQHGLRLQTETPATLHGEYHLVIDGDDELGVAQPWRVDARCMWTGSDVEPPRYLAGFEFESVRPRQRELLAQLIRRLSRG
jgi:hypothetical protein